MSVERTRPERIDWDVYRMPDGSIVIGLMGSASSDPDDLEMPLSLAPTRTEPSNLVTRSGTHPEVGPSPEPDDR